MFAAPAALGVIKKLDDRLELSSLLEAFVLSYSELIEFVRDFFAQIWKISANQAEAILFCVALSISIFVSKFLQPKNVRHFVWGPISSVACILYIGAFSVEDTFYLGNQVLDPFFEIGSYLLLIFGLRVALHASETGRLSLPQRTVQISRIAIWGLIILAPFRFYAYFTETYSLKFEPLPMSLSFFDLLLAIVVFSIFTFAAFFCFFRGNKGPAYVALFICGVLVINFTSVAIIPSAYEFLENIQRK